MENSSGWIITFYKDGSYHLTLQTHTELLPVTSHIAVLYRSEVEPESYALSDMPRGSSATEQAEQFFMLNRLSFEIAPAPTVQPYSDTD